MRQKRKCPSAQEPRDEFTGLTTFLVLALLAFALWVPFSSRTPFDFIIYWKSVSLLAEGENPYALPPRASFSSLGEGLSPATEEQGRTFYVMGSPLTLGVLLPFGFLSKETAQSLYHFLFLLIAITVPFRLWRRLLFERNTLTLRIFTLLAWACPIGLFGLSFEWGAPTILILWGLTEGLIAFKRERFFLAGVCFTLCFIKLHLLLPVLAFLVIWSTRNRKWTFLLGFGASALALLGVTLVLRPTLLEDYLLLVGSKEPFRYLTASLPNNLAALTQANREVIMVGPTLLFSLSTSFLALRRKRLEPISTVLLLIPFSVLLAPYAWGHDFILCLPSVFYLAARSESSRRSGLLRFSFLCLFLSNLVSITFWIYGVKQMNLYLLSGLLLGLCTALAVWSTHGLNSNLERDVHRSNSGR